MTDIDSDRIAHPLRLAAGSHQRGSGKGCAMNVISYTNGDAEITDFPKCSARPLARIVQIYNDHLADPYGYLSPADSLTALDLGWRTVGTADVSDNAIHAWIYEILTSPEWGAIGYAQASIINYIKDIAQFHLAKSRGEEASNVYLTPDAYSDLLRNAMAFLACTLPADSAAERAASHAAVYAARLGRPSLLEFADWAIKRWRELAGLDNPETNLVNVVNSALALIGEP